jgi:hypothetical protein
VARGGKLNRQGKPTDAQGNLHDGTMMISNHRRTQNEMTRDEMCKRVTSEEIWFEAWMEHRAAQCCIAKP